MKLKTDAHKILHLFYSETEFNIKSDTKVQFKWQLEISDHIKLDAGCQMKPEVETAQFRCGVDIKQDASFHFLCAEWGSERLELVMGMEMCDWGGKKVA